MNSALQSYPCVVHILILMIIIKLATMYTHLITYIVVVPAVISAASCINLEYVYMMYVTCIVLLIMIQPATTYTRFVYCT